MAYTMGRPFASLSNAGIALKLPESDRAVMLEEGLGYPLRYDPDDPPSKSYTVLPEESYGDGQQRLGEMLAASIAFCQAQPLKPKRSRKN